MTREHAARVTAYSNALADARVRLSDAELSHKAAQRQLDQYLQQVVAEYEKEPSALTGSIGSSGPSVGQESTSPTPISWLNKKTGS